MFSVEKSNQSFFFSNNRVIFSRGIMEVLSLMKLDMANFNIRQYRPLLQQQAVAYEKATFEKFMENQRCEIDEF